MTNDELRITNERGPLDLWASRPFFVVIRHSSFVIRHSLVLFLFLLPLAGCGRYKARNELKRVQYFAEILRRENMRWIGEDNFFEENLLANRFPEVRQWCAVALARIGSPRSLPLLYRALHTGDARVRAASAFAIGEIEDRSSLEEQSLALDPQATAELNRLLDDSSIAVRMRAIEALGKVGSHPEAAEIVRRLERLPYSGSPVERAYLGIVITALVRLRDPMAEPILKRLAAANDPEIRGRALDALARLQSKTPESLFVGQLQNPDPQNGAITRATAYALAAYRKNSTIARIETTRGPIEIVLFREDAPVTVARFTTMVNRGVYDETDFALPAPFQAVEGGIPRDRADLWRTINSEINMRPFERGSVGMASARRGSDAGRFFIALAPQPYLDGLNTCFGRVISGMQAADKLMPGDRIRRITIKETISFHDYQRYK